MKFWRVPIRWPTNKTRLLHLDQAVNKSPLVPPDCCENETEQTGFKLENLIEEWILYSDDGQ